MFNKVILLGNLTRDIELRYLQNGTAVGKTGIAVTRRYSSANGEKREDTCFIDLDFFGKTAEIANQYLNKGSKILVEGRLKFDQWQDQSGQNRSKHSIAVETMQMLGSSQQGVNQGNFSQNSQSGYNQGAHKEKSNSSYQNSSYSKSNVNNNKQNSEPAADYSQNIPEVDVDADRYDNDETIPF